MTFNKYYQSDNEEITKNTGLNKLNLKTNNISPSLGGRSCIIAQN